MLASHIWRLLPPNTQKEVGKVACHVSHLCTPSRSVIALIASTHSSQHSLAKHDNPSRLSFTTRHFKHKDSFVQATKRIFLFLRSAAGQTLQLALRARLSHSQKWNSPLRTPNLKQSLCSTIPFSPSKLLILDAGWTSCLPFSATPFFHSSSI